MADSDTSRFLIDDLDRRPRCNLLPVKKADSCIGTRSTKLVEGGISESANETQKVVDCLTHDFELKVKSLSDESASDESVSDVNVIHHSDSDDEEDNKMAEYDKVCQDAHSDDDDDWEGQAVFDPLQTIYIRKDSDEPRANITDIRQLHTLRSVINNDPEYLRPSY